MGISQVDKDNEFAKHIKLMNMNLEKLVKAVVGSGVGGNSDEGGGLGSKTKTSKKSEAEKVLEKMEKSLRSSLAKDKLTDFETQKRREVFIEKVMTNKFLRPFYTTYKSLEGHTVNLFNDIKSAWSGVYGKVFSQITEAFRPITGTMMAIYRFTKGVAGSVITKIGEKLWGSTDDKQIADKIESTGKKNVNVLEDIKKWIKKIHNIRKTKSWLKEEERAVGKMYGVDGGDMITPKFMTKWFRMMRRWLPIQFRIRDRWERAKSGMGKILAFGKGIFGGKKEEKEKGKPGEEKKTSFMDMAWKVLKTVTSPLFKILGGMLILGVVNKIFPQVGEFLSKPETWTKLFEGVGKVFIYMKEKISSGLLGFWNALLGDKVAVGEGESIFVKIPVAIGEAFHKAWTEGNTTAKIGAEIAGWFFAIWGVSKLGSVLKLIAGAIPGLALKMAAGSLGKAAVSLMAAAKALIAGGAVGGMSLPGGGGKGGWMKGMGRFLTNLLRNPLTIVAELAALSLYKGMEDRASRQPGDVFADLTSRDGLFTVDKDQNEISLDQYDESQKQTKVLEKSTGYLEQISDFFKKIIGPTEAAAAIIPPPGPQSLDRQLAATRSKESSGDYGAIGPSTKYGQARGAYQIMPGNWEPWSREAEGAGVKLEKGGFGSYLFTRANQDAVAAFKMNQYMERYKNNVLGYPPSFMASVAWANPNLADKLAKGDTSVLSKTMGGGLTETVGQYASKISGYNVATRTTTPKSTELSKNEKAPGTNVAEVKKQEQSLTLAQQMTSYIEETQKKQPSPTIISSNAVSNTAVVGGSGAKTGMDDLPRSISDLFGLQQAVILNSIG